MKNSISLIFILTFFIFTGCSNNNEEFSKAIKAGDHFTVKSLIEEGADVNSKIRAEDGTEKTPLYMAVQDGHTTIARLLINRGADPFIKDSNGLSPIQAAQATKNQEMIDILIQIGYVKEKIIPLRSFRRALEGRVKWYKRSYKSMEREQFRHILTNLKIEDQVLHFYINNIIIFYEAEKLNIKAPESEVKEKIESMPTLQQNGKFIGIDKYRILLARRGIGVAEFENEMRITVLTEKLREKITANLPIDEDKLAKEFAEVKPKSSITFKEFKIRKLEEKKNLFFLDFLKNQKEQYKIRVNTPLFQQVSQSILSKINMPVP